ncbi:MAG: FkbM family methyltransferase [Bacteroidales bacterium]|nr:FkbM family methyltransferase [Bacteroidales bacterium]
MSKISQFLKLIKLRLTDDVKHLKTSIKTPKIWYGNEYAGFFINPNLLNQDSIVYSFGIGTDISFDQEIISKHNAKVFGFDPTPKSINWIKQQNINDNFSFYDFGISNKTEKVNFFLPKNSNYVSGSMVQQSNVNTDNYVEVNMKTLSDIMKELKHTHIDVLKIDIEGSEYAVIENIIESKIDITQLLIEFHDRLFPTKREMSKKAVAQLTQAGYKIFGISHTLEEVSFIK